MSALNDTLVDRLDEDTQAGNTKLLLSNTTNEVSKIITEIKNSKFAMVAAIKLHLLHRTKLRWHKTKI